MGRGLKIAIALAALVALIAIGSFLYLTRGVSAPTIAIEDSVTEIAPSDTSASQIVLRVEQVEYNLASAISAATEIST